MQYGHLKPAYWATWVGLAAMRALELLPYRVQRRVASFLGGIISRLPLSRLRIARRNIEICLPDLSAVNRAVLLEEHCRSLAMGLCETANTWWSSNRRVLGNANVEGLGHLQTAFDKGRGAILIGGHFTTIEMATRILGTHIPLNFVFRPPKNAVLAQTMYESFRRHGNPIAYDDIRAMIRALKNNEAVWYAPDQSYRNKGAAMVSFFGTPARGPIPRRRVWHASRAPRC